MGFASLVARDRIARSMHSAECVCEGAIESCDAYQGALAERREQSNDAGNSAAEAVEASTAVGR